MIPSEIGCAGSILQFAVERWFDASAIIRRKRVGNVPLSSP